MTGLHTGHCHVRGNQRVPLRPSDVTVAEVLKEAGYATAIVGKWGLGEPNTTGIPNRQGFDYWFGYLNQHAAHNYYPEFLWRNEERYRLEGNVVPVDNIASERAQYCHDLFTDEALRFVERHRHKPFFLYLAYTMPHANNERGRAEGDGMEVPSYEPYIDEAWPQPEKGKAAMITRMDRDIGRLVNHLQNLGLDQNTVVFFSSDNGPHAEGGVNPDFFRSSGPMRGIKRDLYEGAIRVPMVVRWPHSVQAGAVSDQVWAFWDFLPTAAELAGTTPPSGLDGISMVPTLLGAQRAGRKQENHDFLYWEFHERGFQQAVRMGDSKAVRRAMGEPLELYDLSRDLAEQTNVAAEYPDTVARIESYLDGARTESEHWAARKRP